MLVLQVFFVLPADSLKDVLLFQLIGFAFEAELAATIHAISITLEKAWHTLWLETNSTYLVVVLRTRSLVVHWHWRPAWIRCLEYVSKMHVHVSHIHHEGNKAADYFFYRDLLVFSLLLGEILLQSLSLSL